MCALKSSGVFERLNQAICTFEKPQIIYRPKPDGSKIKLEDRGQSSLQSSGPNDLERTTGLLKKTQSLTSFKSRLKTHYFNKRLRLNHCKAPVCISSWALYKKNVFIVFVLYLVLLLLQFRI